VVGKRLCKQGGLQSALLLICFFSAWIARADSIAIHWRNDTTRPAVEVTGIAPDTLSLLTRVAPTASTWPRLFAVYAEQEHSKNVPPMTGRWRVAGDRLVFEPQFPLARGVRYRAEYREKNMAAPVIAHFELPADTTAPSTRVVQVYPSADVLPENQLKFYVHFSAPMSRRATYEHVRVCDERGNTIELPFLELDEELWDPTMTRLTLLIDPGRIKRGVKPLEDIGPVFEAEKSYALIVAASCRDAAGRPLREEFRKNFRAVAADRTPPDPERWKLRAPAAGTREPLVVEFDEPMEHALALRLISVELKAGRSIRGETALAEQERRWMFTPDQPWSRGAHALIVATTIEDLAGNNIGKPFDVDVSERVDRRVETKSVRVPFAIP
jgi:hypothetical protein